MNKKQEEQFDKIFGKSHDIFFTKENEEMVIRAEVKDVKQFISTLQKDQRKEIIEQLDQLSLCMGNEWTEGARYNAVQKLIKSLK